MSSDFVDNIHIRLREELERLGLSQAEAARQIGEKNSQGLRDACTGRNRLTVDLLGRLKQIGVDAFYVLDGRRTPILQQARPGYRWRELSERADKLVDNYESQGDEAQRVIERASDPGTKSATKVTKTRKEK